MKKIIFAIAVSVALFSVGLFAQSSVNIANDVPYSITFQLNTSTYGVAASSSVIKTGSCVVKAILITRSDNVSGHTVSLYDTATAIGGNSAKITVDVDTKFVFPLGAKFSTGLFILNTSTAGVVVVYK